MMAEKIRKLANSEVEVLSRIVAECWTGSQMNGNFSGMRSKRHKQ